MPAELPGGEKATTQCLALLALHHWLLGVLLPVLIAARIWHSQPAPHAAAPRPAAWPAAAAAAVVRAWRRADAELAGLLGLGDGLDAAHAVLAAYMCGGSLWVLAKAWALEGPPLA